MFAFVRNVETVKGQLANAGSPATMTVKTDVFACVPYCCSCCINIRCWSALLRWSASIIYHTCRVLESTDEQSQYIHDTSNARVCTLLHYSRHSSSFICYLFMHSSFVCLTVLCKILWTCIICLNYFIARRQIRCPLKRTVGINGLILLLLFTKMEARI